MRCAYSIDSIAAETFKCYASRDRNYSIRKDAFMNKLLKLLLGTGLYLLEQSDNTTKNVRDRAVEQIDDLRNAAQQKYETAANRVARASRAIRGDDNDLLRSALFFAAGTGIGIGVGLILAPASGEETRSEIAGRVRDIGDKVRRQFSDEDIPATGT
jgi:gas vesicle protein